MAEINSYSLSRTWFDWCFLNPEKINPNHSALYFFCIEHCNRLGWKEKFGLPTTMAKEAIGIRSYNTYIKTLNDLVDFGFIELIERSKNQYSSNIIALSNFDKALDKALDKAFIKHTTKQSESTQQSICSIDKQITNKQITNNDEQREEKTPSPPSKESSFVSSVKMLPIQKLYEYLRTDDEVPWMENICINHKIGKSKDDLDLLAAYEYLKTFTNHIKARGETEKTLADFKEHFNNWLRFKRADEAKIKVDPSRRILS